MGGIEERSHVGEEGSTDLAGGIALLPEVALESLEVRDLDIAGYEISNVGLQLRARVAVLFRESIAIGGKCRAVPFLIQNLGKCFEGIRKLSWKEGDGD
jgi:hypothetical protein